MEQQEFWIPIKDFEDKYEVSNLARVRSIKTGLILKPQLGGETYYYYLFYNEKTKKRIKCKLHRLVGLHHVPNPYGFTEVNHKDGDKLNNMPSNIEWCSRSQNMKHAFAMGLNKSGFKSEDTKGEKNPKAKLTKKQVATIRRLYAKGGWTYQALGDKYGVSADSIYRIIKYISWIN